MMLIRDADFLITMAQDRAILRRHSVFVERDRIRDIGPTDELDQRYLSKCEEMESVINARGCLVLPGYVNTHIHTFEHLSRGLIPDDLPTFDWAVQYARPFYCSLTEDEAYLAAKLACVEMLQSGTTCFVDTNILLSSGHFDAVAQAVDEIGMRAVLGLGVFDQMPPEMAARIPEAQRRQVVFPSANAALKAVEGVLSGGTHRSRGRVRIWASIYGLFPYCSDELFAGIGKVAEQFGVGTAFHMASSLGEAQAVEARTGVWPITRLDELKALGSRVLLTHCTAITNREVELLAERGTSVAYCPGAALRLAKGTTSIGKIPEMLAAGVTLSLGADGVSSSGSFDPTRLMALVAGLFKDARMDASLIPAEQALEMTTVNGAKAVLCEDELGSIVPGMKADMVIYDIQRPEWVPVHDVVRNLVYCADGRSVQSVICDGRVVYRNGAIPGVDMRALAAEAEMAGQAIAARVGLDPRHRWPIKE